ncbi:hypothetical protein HanPSC8_Chr10g0442241 [Helianthus annuus]|nr:hypothetical protein HanPSC8_Chr10g0442241 [Helianthus annuus]
MSERKMKFKEFLKFQYRMKYKLSFGDRDGLVAGEMIGTFDLLPMAITKSACEDVVGPRIAAT